MNYIQLLEKVKLYLRAYYTEHLNEEIVYHNLEHTEDVVESVSVLANHYMLSDHDLFVVLTAAWFHDAGYYNGPVSGHEQRGAGLASGFLKQQGVDDATINTIEQCILATVMPQRPTNLLQQIVCDADLSNLGSGNFSRRNKLLRKETELRQKRHIPKDEWRADTIRFLQQHRYHTDYGIQLYDGKRLEHIKELQQKAAGEEPVSPGSGSVGSIAHNEPVAVIQDTKKNKKDDRPERGIETMFRISSGNHQRLSDMADNKAHIMITTNSIIISVLLGLLLRKLEDNPQLILPTTLLLGVSVVTLVFCILATRPKLPPGKFTHQDIEDKKVNLLFFGNFYKMKYEEYEDGMKAMMNDREFLYGSLTRDLYSQGIVLGHKYRLLRIGYNVFMFGIVVSVIAFIVASVL